MSVKKLNIENHKEVLELFEEDIENYHFLLNDLLNNNYSGDSFHVFGEYENGVVVSLLLNNFNNVTYYSRTQRNIEVYKDVIKDLNFTKLSGRSDLICKFIPYVNVKKDTISHLGVVKKVVSKRSYPDIEVRIVQTEEEIGMQYELLLSTNEFIGSLPESKKLYIKSESERLKHTSDRTAYLSIDNEMVSSAATIREGEKSAIVIGVFTSSEHRKQGFGTEVLIGLFEMLLKDGKYPYLFYTNPAARSVYKNLGMEEICEWRVIEIE